MSEITIPFHLVIPTIIGIVALVIIFLKRKILLNDQKRKYFWISIAIFFAVYIIIVGGATISDLYCQWDLNRYDLDKDGIFSGAELSEEQDAAMSRLTNDIGRNFSFVIGLIFSAFISIPIYIFGNLYEQSSKQIS